jgi:uroporphyrinogen-III synthase
LQDVAGRHIVIVRGNGGRELIRETLEERGARVEYVEVYRRQIPNRNPANLIANWEQMVEAVTITSGQILENLFTLLSEEGGEALKSTPMVVVSERIAEQAAALGCQIVYLADSAMDKDLLTSLCEIFETHYR